MLRRFSLATVLLLSPALVLGQPITHGAIVSTEPAAAVQSERAAVRAVEKFGDLVIEKIVSGPFVGLASKPTHGLYMKATPEILNGKLRIEVRRRDEVLLTEKLSIPASVTKATAVVFLAHVGDMLDQLRKVDAAAPGIVTVRVTKGDKVLVETSLTEFDAAGASVRPRERVKSRFAIAPQSECTDSCDDTYNFCLSYCDPRGNECATCWDQYEACINDCGCNTWNEVSRTKIGGAMTGSFGIQGLWWCRVTSYYIVEQENAGGCSANRFVCDTDTVTFFCCSYEPEEGDCCHYTDPQDISHSDFCGGDICP